jgi:hypothetical protein
LEDDLEPPSTKGSPQQLVAITVGLVAPNLEIHEEALDGLLESDVMGGQLIAFKVILEVNGPETLPIRHGLLFLSAAMASRRAAAAH